MGVYQYHAKALLPQLVKLHFSELFGGYPQQVGVGASQHQGKEGVFSVKRSQEEPKVVSARNACFPRQANFLRI